MNTPTSHVHHTHEYIHHTKWNHTLTNDYSSLSQSVLSLYMKMSMPLPATRDILVCDGTNRTLLELTTQTRTQQLPEEYVKVVHSAVLTSIHLISSMLNQLSHTTLVNSSSSTPSHTTVLDPQDSYMLTSSQISHHARYIQSLPSPSLLRSSLLGWPSYFNHILNGSPMDQLLTARSRWIWKPLISQLSLQSTVTVSAIVSKPHPHVTNMLMVSLTSNRPYSTSGLRQVKVIPLFITAMLALVTIFPTDLSAIP